MQKLFRLKNYFIILFLALIGISAFTAKDLHFQYDIESFFPENDPELDFLKEFKAGLEPDDAYMWVAIERDRSIFDTAFLQQLDSFTLQARTLPHVSASASITTLQNYIKTPFGFTPIPLVHPDNAARLKQDSARLYADSRWIGNFFTEDATAALVMLKTEPNMPQEHSREAIKALDSLTAAYGFTNVHAVSRPHAQISFLDRIEKELKLYVVLGIGLLIIIMILVFRTFWGVAVPLISSISGLVLFMGYLRLIGHEMNIMSVLYPVLLLTIGMSDIIHIMNKYIEEQRRGLSRVMAMERTIREIGLATFLTSAATATGFLASLTVPIAPVREFSFNAAVGVLIAYGTVLFFTTALLLHFDAHKLSRGRQRGSRFWDKLVLDIYLFVRRYPLRIGLFWTIVLLLSAWGVYRISTNTYLLTDVPRDSQLRDDYHFFEQKLNGARPIDIAVLPKPGYDMSDLEVLRQADTLAAYLGSRAEFGAMTSPAMVYKSLNMAWHGGQPAAYRLPQEQPEADQYAAIADRYGGGLLSVLVKEDGSMGRITGRMQDLGSEKVKELFGEVNRWAQQHTDTSVVEFRVTGSTLVIDRNNDYLRESLFTGLGLAFLAIGIMMAFMFRSLKMVVISIVPNIFPLVVCGAVMGLTGIELKASTAIIFEIVFGIAVNDTIHFLTQYRLETAKGLRPEIAIRNTFRETGKSIILTTVILFAGAATLITSNFSATYYIGLLMSVAFVSAVLADLLILPILLKWVYGKGR